MSINEIRSIIRPILERNGVVKAGIFGSFVRKENNERSDLDILVDIKKNISLLDFIGIKIELEDALGMKVDLLEYDAIKPALKDYILSEEVPV